MSDNLPRTVNRPLQFVHGTAIGISNRWQAGQYCSILTARGIVGCGIYDLPTAAEFSLAIAIARGTPAKPLVEPEDLFAAKIVGVTPQAEAMGIRVGITGKEAVELMLQAEEGAGRTDAPAPIGVKAIDHVTMIVEDLERSANFYVNLLGMRRVERPAFKFPGLWFQAGETQVHLIEKSDESGPPGQVLPPENVGAGRVFHFAYEVTDCRAATARLKEVGVRLRGGPSLRPDGCVQTWCYDPDNHVVELFSRT